MGVHNYPKHRKPASSSRARAHHRTIKRWRWTVAATPINAIGPNVQAEFPTNEVCDAVLVGFLHDGYVLRQDRDGSYWMVRDKLLHNVTLTHTGWRKTGIVRKPQRYYDRAWMTEV